MLDEHREVSRRKRTVHAARRSSELEGSQSTAATRADQDAYIRGHIRAPELVHRVRCRYNVERRHSPWLPSEPIYDERT